MWALTSIDGESARRKNAVSIKARLVHGGKSGTWRRYTGGWWTLVVPAAAWTHAGGVAVGGWWCPVHTRQTAQLCTPQGLNLAAGLEPMVL